MIVKASLYYQHNLFMILLILLPVGLTSFYTIRFCVVWGPNNCSSFIQLEESNSLTKPMLILASMSVISGASILWFMPLKQEMLFIPLYMKLLPSLMVVLGATMAWMISSVSLKSSYLMNNSLNHYASCMMWYLVPLSSQMTMKIPMYVSHEYLKLVDQSWLELISGQGMTMLSNKSSAAVNYLMMSSVLMTLMLV